MDNVPRAIGHIVLHVSDVERSVKFYRDVIGFEVSRYQPGGNTAFLTCGEIHHDLALFKAPEGAQPYKQSNVGLHHFAFEMESYEALQGAYKRLVAAGAKMEGTVDFGFMRTVSVSDPDGMKLELFINAYATDEEGLAAMKYHESPPGRPPTYDINGPQPPVAELTHDEVASKH
ncbi:MAG TPA: VOC family protein [Chloroflexota bacterium]|jgi:catechol 2,3-dioxygenase